jgi:hypothetical protein
LPVTVDGNAPLLVMIFNHRFMLTPGASVFQGSGFRVHGSGWKMSGYALGTGIKMYDVDSTSRKSYVEYQTSDMR